MTVFNSGVYTACEPCKAHPERPPLWQIRAAKIIENQQTHVVYYEDAWLEVAGVPVAYVPYFSAPDPTVTRQSGLLAPTFTHGSYVGTGIGVPYFLNLAPSYDLTLTPTYFTSQGPFLDAEWRQRLNNGQYDVRANGLSKKDPGLFRPIPTIRAIVAGAARSRSTGEFYINDKWRWGWDVTAMSDPFYLNDYKIKDVDPSQYYLQDVVSSVYLRGQADRGFFDLSGYQFESTTAAADQRQQPVAAPCSTTTRRSRLARRDRGLGGEIKLDLNADQHRARRGAYQSTGAITLDQAYQPLQRLRRRRHGRRRLQYWRTLQHPPTSLFAAGNCLLRGIAGDYARISEQVSWQRKFVDPLGETWTPFVFARSMARRRRSTPPALTTTARAQSTTGQTNYFGAASAARPDAPCRASAWNIAIRSFRPPPLGSRSSSRSPS